MFSCAFLLLGLVPAGIVKLVFKEKLAGYGVQWGNWRLAVLSFLVLAPLWLLLTYVGSRSPGVGAWYPLNKSAGDSPAMFGLHAVTFLVFYLGYEFHFRGYLQFGLKEAMGDVNAMLVGVMGTVLIHTGKPLPGETFGAFLMGMLWGVLVFRSRTLLTSLLQHALLGLSLDFYLCYT
jgi:membrane protease YdiL (CAAX protease family)